MAPVQNSHASGTWYLHRKRISERKITLHEEQNHRCGAMVSVRISYLSDDSLRASQIMAIWPSFDSSLEFPSVAPPATLPLPISPSWSPRPSQMVTAAQTGRRARPGATSSWHVPPPYLPITLTFIQLLFLHPRLAWLHLLSMGCLPSVCCC